MVTRYRGARVQGQAGPGTSYYSGNVLVRMSHLYRRYCYEEPPALRLRSQDKITYVCSVS